MYHKFSLGESSFLGEDDDIPISTILSPTGSNPSFLQVRKANTLKVLKTNTGQDNEISRSNNLDW